VIKKPEIKLKHTPAFSYEIMLHWIAEDDEKQQGLA